MPKLRGWKDKGIIDIWTLTLVRMGGDCWGWDQRTWQQLITVQPGVFTWNLRTQRSRLFRWMIWTLVCLPYRYIFLCLTWFYPNVVQHDELREIFNDISSSSEDEDEEGERHEDEDLNIMDTEDDMVRQLHEKLNETEGDRDENDRNSQIGRMAGHKLSDQLQCIVRTAAQAQFKTTIQYHRLADRQANKSRPRLAFEWWAFCGI